jgi:hypothetical protein
MFRAFFSAQHQELKTVHAESGTSHTCLVRPLARVIWVSSDSPMLAVAPNKFD